MTNIFKNVLLHIIKAQVASDLAKGVEFPEYNKIINNRKRSLLQGRFFDDYDYDCIRYDRDCYYNTKDKELETALRLIDSHPRMGINYYVIRKNDQNGHKSNIIYFIFKIDGKRYQMSFHNFKRSIRYNYAEPRKGLQCHWERGNGGCRKEAVEIINIIYK